METSLQAFYTPEAAEAATVLRGLPPAAFIMSPQDIIVARVRDIDDKVISINIDRWAVFIQIIVLPWWEWCSCRCMRICRELAKRDRSYHAVGVQSRSICILVVHNICT